MSDNQNHELAQDEARDVQPAEKMNVDLAPSGELSDESLDNVSGGTYVLTNVLVSSVKPPEPKK